MIISSYPWCTYLSCIFFLVKLAKVLGLSIISAGVLFCDYFSFLSLLIPSYFFYFVSVLISYIEYFICVDIFEYKHQG